jgi:hypothetical protein
MSCNFTFFTFFFILGCSPTSQKVDLLDQKAPVVYRVLDNNVFIELLQKSHLSFHFEKIKELDDGILLPLVVQDYKFQLAVQYIPSPPMIYLSINDYLWLDQSKTPRSTSFTLTQIAVQNHEVVGAKIQLNPQNGSITFAHEIHIPNGLYHDVFLQSLHQLVDEAVRNYPMLKASLEENGY